MYSAGLITITYCNPTPIPYTGSTKTCLSIKYFVDLQNDELRERKGCRYNALWEGKDQIWGYFSFPQCIILEINRGFSCDVISSQFCKSYLRPHVGFHFVWHVLENTTKCPVTFFLFHTPQYQITSE